MKLWGGRFTKEENQLVHNFNESLSFDRKLYHQDIEGSVAHVTMLARQGDRVRGGQGGYCRRAERDSGGSGFREPFVHQRA